VKRALLLTLVGLALLATWLLATASGLRAALAVAERLSGGKLVVREAHGALNGDVQLLGIAITTPAATVTIEQAELDLRLTRLLLGRVQAEYLKVRKLAVVVHARPPPAPGVERRPIHVSAPLRLAVEDGQVDDFRLKLASGREWGVPAVQFAGRWRAEWIVLARLKARTREAGWVQARGRLAITDDLLQFEEFEVTAPSPVTIEGALALTPDEESVLRLGWRQLRWPQLPGQDARLGWLLSPSGTLALEGPWDGYRWTLDARALAAGIPAEVKARGSGNLKSLALDEIRARALDGTLGGRGAVAWSPALTTDLELSWQGLDPAAQFAGWPGKLAGGAALHARWGEQPQVEFDGRLADSELRGYPLALQARGRTEGDSVRLHELGVQSGASELRASGALWPRAALHGTFKSTDLRSLWAGLRGQAEARFSVAGTPDTLRFGMHASAQAPGYRMVRARTLALEADVGFQGHSQATLRIDGLEAGVAFEQVLLTGAGTRDRHEAALTVTGAAGNAALKLTGGERAGTWRGALNEATLTPAEAAPAWRLEEPAALGVGVRGLRLEPACLAGPDSRACFDLDLAAGAQRVAFRIHEFALANLKPWLPPSWAVSGGLSGTASLQVRDGELAALRTDLAGSAGAIDGDGVRLEYGPGLLRVQPEDDGRLHALVELTPAGGTVRGEVWVTAGGDLLDRPMLGELRVNLPDLAWLPVISPEIASAQGSIDAELSVSGTPRGPALAGRLQVAGGRVRLATPGIELTEIAASFERGKDAPLNAHVSAKSGDGQFTLDGVLRTLQPKATGEFKLKGEQVLGYNTPELRAWITPDLTLVLDGRTARLTGEVTVPRADITPREIHGGGIAPSGDQVVVSHDEAAAASAIAVESQVRVVLGERVRFDGLGLKTRLEGAITAHDEIGRATTGRGELRLVGGRYKAYGQDLQIETGRLLFNGGPITDPAIDLAAFRQLPPLTGSNEIRKVGLRARGTLAAPEFSLYSTDPDIVTQEQRLSWLVLGRPLEQARTGEAGQVDSAATSLGLTGGDLLAQQLAPRLGLDEVSVGTRPGETADLARLTIGKYLSPRLFMSYGYGLFQPGHFFRLQYDLSRRFKLLGESGLNQGGDLLYTIEAGRKD
jgi:translocation and assembly module TamB